MLVASPHSHDPRTNSSVDSMKSRTGPKRWVSQPVSGTAMALATANDVMTHVPWLVLTARSPDIAGMETLAIDVSSTTMNVAADSANVPATRLAPVSGAGTAGGTAGGAVEAGAAAIVVVMWRRARCACRSVAARAT